MKSIAVLFFGLMLTVGMIGCKKEETPPAEPAATDAAAPAETPAEDAAP